MMLHGLITVDSTRAEAVKRMPRIPRSGARPIAEQTRRLRDGEMLFTTDRQWRPPTKTLAKAGLKIKQKSADGGRYYWAE